ncbi:hypothetical protein SAMN05216359_110143 [Roseateles sp. YR242]|uniref:lantibiotic dehydratase n=1 Tax=Roseateles sp. YR242 TaxID=1855305 RepID=UPI0008C29819|nr:lantibiotic dehydratase [Roseateles sp. YR242]SEL52151.1 hypothetical protein SAMN05216359_110143 [Roseateles sp. YR242]
MQPSLNATAVKQEGDCAVGLIGLEEGTWCFATSILLRASGFPADRVLRLSPDEALPRACDAVLEAEAALTDALDALDRQTESLLAPVLQAARAGKLSRDAARAATREHRHAVARLKAGETVVLGHSDLQAIGAAVVSARAQHVAAMARLQQVVEQDTERLRQVLRETVDDRMQTAILWQNPEAFRHAVLPWLEGRDSSPKKCREREQLLLALIQRYAVKNDTIGFFGPVNWAHLVPTPEGSPPHGRDVEGIALAEVFFEDWAMVALVAELTRDDDYLLLKTARRAPQIALRDGALCFPGGHRVELPELDQRLWEGCNGRTPVASLINRMLRNPYLACTREQVVQRLCTMRDKRWLHVSMPIPTREPRPERWLQAYLDRNAERAGDSSPQAQALMAAVQPLVLARDRLAQAREAQELMRAQSAMGEIFQALGGQQSTRLAGSHYAGRTLAYQDCLSSRDVAISLPEHRTVFQSLDLVMQCAGWFIDEIWALVSKRLQDRHAQLAPGGLRVNLADYWPQVESLFFGDELDLSPLQQRLQQALSDCLDVAPAAGGALPIAEVGRRVQQRFSTPGAWAGPTGMVCPDLLLASLPAVDGHRRDDYAAVLGEIHIGGLTLCTNGFSSLTRHGEALARLRDDLTGQRRVASVLNGIDGGRPIRTQWRESPGTTEILFSFGAIPDDGNPHHAIADLWIGPAKDGGEALEITNTADSERFSLAEIFGDFLFARIANAFKLGTEEAHQPRVTVGPLVWIRESWRLPAARMSDIAEASSARAIVELTRLRRDLGLPQRVFLKLKNEPKPVFMDLVSPPFIALLQSMLRRQLRADPQAMLVFSEVLPDMDRLWLSDRNTGQVYTSELRLAAFARRHLPPQASRDLIRC